MPATGHVERVPTDLVADDLVRTYEAGIRRLEAEVRLGLARGLDPTRLGTDEQRVGDATLAYRVRQRRQALAIVDELRRAGVTAAPVVTARAYGAGIVAVDAVLADLGVAQADVLGRFGGVHQRAVQVLASNMSRTLEAAARRAGENVGTVFDRADAIEGALDPGSPEVLRGLPFIGRRLDDPYRRLALETVGAGLVALERRRDVSAQLVRRLVDEGVTDALTGFVDRAGRRWPLDRYAAMVARTTTREATSRAAMNRLAEHGQDLVTISTHNHAADECTPYDGRTFSISGRDADYPRLDRMPPFHPNCRHVVTPAATSLEDFERELGLAAEAPSRLERRRELAELEAERPPAPIRVDTPPARVTAPPPRRPAPGEPGGGPPARPGNLGGRTSSPYAEPRAPVERLAVPTRPPQRTGVEDDLEYGPGTQDRLDDQAVAELLYGGRHVDTLEDPGPDPSAFDALVREAEADERLRLRAIRAELGPDLARLALGAKGTRPRAYARKLDLKGKLLRGELTARDVERIVVEEEEELYRESQERELRRSQPKVRPVPCFQCGRLKRLASNICQSCGHDPVAYVDAMDATSGGYVEDASGGSSYVESSGMTEARRRFDVGFYGVDPTAPRDPNEGAIGWTRSAFDAQAAGARRRRALRDAQEGRGRRR